MPSVPSASLVAARKRMGNMSKSFAACSPEAANYGGCITGKLNTIEKGVCEAEFRRLAECMKRHAAKQ
eukprot:gene7746-3985_t